MPPATGGWTARTSRPTRLPMSVSGPHRGGQSWSWLTSVWLPTRVFLPSHPRWRPARAGWRHQRGHHAWRVAWARIRTRHPCRRCSSAARGAAGVSAILRRVCTLERELDHTGSAESLFRLSRQDAPGVSRGLSHYAAARLVVEFAGSMEGSPSTLARDPTGTAAWSQPATRTRGARGHESAPVNTPQRVDGPSARGARSPSSLTRRSIQSAP